MALLTVAEFKDTFETDLSTDAIQRLLDGAEEQIIRAFGPHTTDVTEDLIGGALYLYPSRPIVTVTSITETVLNDDTLLVASDFKLLRNGRQVQRLADGTNGRAFWGDFVRLIYAPESETKIREPVQVDLVKLAIQYEGLDSSKSGNFQSKLAGGVIRGYEGERAAILNRLRRGVAFV